MGSLEAASGAAGNGGGVADQALALEIGAGINGQQHKAAAAVVARAPVLANGGAGGKATKKKISPKDRYWVAADEGEMEAATADGGEDGLRPLLYRNFRVRGILLHPYRCVSLFFLGTFVFAINRCRVRCVSNLVESDMSRRTRDRVWKKQNYG